MESQGMDCTIAWGIDGEARAEAGRPDVDAAGRRVPDYVRRAQAGDAAAFREIYRRHRHDVAALALRVSQGRGSIEDLVQDVFLQVFRSVCSFRGESNFRTWLYRLTVNVVLLGQRREGRWGRTFMDADVAEFVQREDESPSAVLSVWQRVRLISGILGKLTDKRRETFVQHDLEGVSAQEIADAEGIPLNTVRTRLFYARRAVYSALCRDPEMEQIVLSLGLAAPRSTKTRAAAAAQ